MYINTVEALFLIKNMLTCVSWSTFLPSSHTLAVSSCIPFIRAVNKWRSSTRPPPHTAPSSGLFEDDPHNLMRWERAGGDARRTSYFFFNVVYIKLGLWPHYVDTENDHLHQKEGLVKLSDIPRALHCREVLFCFCKLHLSMSRWWRSYKIATPSLTGMLDQVDSTVAYHGEYKQPARVDRGAKASTILHIAYWGRISPQTWSYRNS